MSNKRRLEDYYDIDTKSIPKKKRKISLTNTDQKEIENKKQKPPKWLCQNIWDYNKHGGIYSMKQLAEASTFLEKNGFVVISDVIDNKDNIEAQKLLLNDIKEINKNNANVQNINNINQITNKELPGWASNGLRYQFAISHGKFAHFSRLRPNIKKIFAHFHKCNENELNCSWDSIAITPPNHKHKKTLWLHADQSIYNDKNKKIPGWDYLSIQGALYYTETNKYTVSFICSPQSHIKHWHKLAVKARTKLKHWILLDNDEKMDDEYIKMKQEIIDNSFRIHVPKNSFLLWDSKIFHQNGDCISNNNGNKDEMKRIASFICMAHNKYRTYKAFKNSLIYAVNGATSTHWPQFMIAHSSKHPRFSKGNCYENMCDIKPKLNEMVSEKEFQKMIPLGLKGKEIKVYNSDKMVKLTLETVHHLGIRDLGKFKVVDLWNLIDPQIKMLQPWMDPK
eukprot:302514_1